MSFLWNVSQKPMMNLSTRPSPKRKKYSFFGGFIERASLLGFLKSRMKAGMTVEAALVLPLFLFFFLNLGSSLEMLRLHGNLQLALWNVGNRMCMYGYMTETQADKEDGVDAESSSKQDKDTLINEIGEIALTYTYVKGQVVDYVGADYLAEAPLSDGSHSLQFWESEVGEAGQSVVSGDVLDIVMTYQVEPFMEIPYVRPFRMSNRYYGRLWTGYDLNEKEDLVYVAENASVYHESPVCTHLKLTIRYVFLSDVLRARNDNGEKYDKCSKCGDGAEVQMVYITREGDFYHKKRQCPGLKRTIHAMPRSEAEEKYKACSRCGRE